METESSEDRLPNDECTNDLDLFFANELYNSCKATDALIKNIEKSQDEALARKALALYQRHYSSLERPWDHVTFMYGLGLIYMHFNAYTWAVKAFREAIFVQPSFIRSRDVHTRLGLIFKSTGRYKLSEKHFAMAINDTRPNNGVSTRLELEFHIAHLYEIQGKLKQAKEAYERLLQENDLPQQLSANIHRQLGWMCFHSDIDLPPNNRKQNMFNHQNALSNNKVDTALNYLNTSYQTDSDPKTSYYLGRCFTNIGKFQDAFASYRSVIDREESTADTWCSIGVLYHRQNQPMDALQAYIRSVQFNKQHSVAWMNMGILYENHNQFYDALKCYQHVLRSNSDGVDRSLQARIRYIQRQIADFESSLSNSGKSKLSSDKLLSLEDLWNLESRQSSMANTNSSKTPTTKIEMSLPHIPRAISQPNEIPINVERKPNGSILNQNDQKNKNISPSNTCANTVTRNLNSDSNQKPHSEEELVHPNSKPTGNHIGMLNDCKLEKSNQDCHDLKPQPSESKDLTLNQALTNGTSKDSGISSNSSTYAECTLVPSQNTNANPANNLFAEQVIEACRNSPRPNKLDINVFSDDERPPHMFSKPLPYPPIPQDKLSPIPPSIFLESKKDLASRRLQDCCQSSPISIVRNIASILKLDLGLFSTKTLVESQPDHPVDIISHALDLPSDTSTSCEENGRINSWACECHESVSTISRYASYQVASFRESLQEEKESKLVGTKGSLTKESETDSNESASMQAKKMNSNSQSSSYFNPDSNQNSNLTNNLTCKNSSSKKFKSEPPKVKFVKSADKIDLSDEKKWRAQLTELNKLPNFIKCVSASNMLTHAGSTLPGVNTVVMNMHVPGCRILGNKTPNNFCYVNINVGPGDYEWCATSAEYSSIITRLCNRHGFEFEDKKWWPLAGDLQKYNVPVYRFSQRPGDLVWVNSGTIFWVQANGWCNNIQWNVGPLCARQFRSASESFELNKFLFRRSDVPMIQLTWNIVININIIIDDDLFGYIVDILRRSLRYCMFIKDLMQEYDCSINQVEGELGPRKARFCSLCEFEVFNIYFMTKNGEELHCVECARRLDQTFKKFEIRQEYGLEYLMRLHDTFIETRNKFLNRQQMPRQNK